jgi:hypothetical protein
VKGLEGGGIEGLAGETGAAGFLRGALAGEDLGEIEQQGMLAQSRLAMDEQGVRKPRLGQALAEALLGVFLSQGAGKIEGHGGKVRKRDSGGKGDCVTMVTGF